MSFALQLQRFAELAKANADEVVQKVTIDVARSVIMKSPVGNPDLWKSPAPAGYVGGRFRANWVFGVGAVNNETTDAIDDSGSATISKLSKEISRIGAGVVTYISNSLPYGPRIEYEGWSKQAPGGMVRVTVVEFQQFVNNAVSQLGKR